MGWQMMRSYFSYFSSHSYVFSLASQILRRAVEMNILIGDGYQVR